MHNSLYAIYLLGFLFSLQVALANYVNSSYLSTLMSAKLVSIIYVAEAIIAIGGFMLMPRILSCFGNFRVTICLLLVGIFSVLGLVFYNDAILASIFMVISMVVITFLYFTLDIFLEAFSFDTSTGRIRGVYLSIVNLAWIFGPLLAGAVLTNGDYWKIYFASFFIMILVFLIVRTTLFDFQDSRYEKTNPFATLKSVWNDRNIRNIFMAVLLLQLFYAWMTIYTPYYLHTNLGLSWKEIGVIFSIMLLPFVFIQLPAGKLADSRFGEKEMLSIGFVIIALFTSALYFNISSNVYALAVILFGTRVGAALVEVMCDVYFFKKVDQNNTNLISFFRMAKPLAYIVGPILALVFLNLFDLDIKSLFGILAIIMILGLRFSLCIKDTK